LLLEILSQSKKKDFLHVSQSYFFWPQNNTAREIPQGVAIPNVQVNHTPVRGNPVSLRLYKVLSTNFDDEDTRQALGTLSDLYATPKGKDTLAFVEELDDEVLNDSVDASRVPTMLAESISSIERRLHQLLLFVLKVLLWNRPHTL